MRAVIYPRREGGPKSTDTGTEGPSRRLVVLHPPSTREEPLRLTRFHRTFFASLDRGSPSLQVGVLGSDGAVVGETAFSPSGEGLGPRVDGIVHGPAVDRRAQHPQAAPGPIGFLADRLREAKRARAALVDGLFTLDDRPAGTPRTLSDAPFFRRGPGQPSLARPGWGSPGTRRSGKIPRVVHRQAGPRRRAQYRARGPPHDRVRRSVADRLGTIAGAQAPGSIPLPGPPPPEHGDLRSKKDPTSGTNGPRRLPDATDTVHLDPLPILPANASS